MPDVPAPGMTPHESTQVELAEQTQEAFDRALEPNPDHQPVPGPAEGFPSDDEAEGDLPEYDEIDDRAAQLAGFVDAAHQDAYQEAVDFNEALHGLAGSFPELQDPWVGSQLTDAVRVMAAELEAESDDVYAEDLVADIGFVEAVWEGLREGLGGDQEFGPSPDNTFIRLWEIEQEKRIDWTGKG
jgi:ribosomal protein S18 acetylase RimI-like enzyme